MKKVKNLSTIQAWVIDIYIYIFFSLKKVKLPIKPSQKIKNPNLSDIYIKKKLMLKEVLTSFRVFK